MRFRALCVFALVGVFPACALAAVPPSFSDKVRAAAEDVLSRTGSPSASVAVVVDDRIVLAQAYGLARLKPPVQASAATRYGIGSISKEFTAAAILILESEGKLSLDDHVSKWFPDLTDADKITVRQILSHTAGYQDFYAEDYTLTPMQMPATPEAIMAGWAK
jgi:D-alanyl-D-alanine carboxypeptidase